MNGLVLLATIVQAVLVNGGASSYFVRMPYPNPAGVTYSEITPYRTASSPIVVSSPATPVPSVPVINSEVIPKIGLSAGWQPEVNGLSVVNDTACIYEQCGTGDLAETAKVLFIPSKIQDVYESKLGTRFTGTQQNSRLLDLNYPVCYLPVDNSIVTPLIYVQSFGHQPGPIYNVPISGFQIPSGPLFTPQNPPLPLLPPFQVPDFFPQVPGESFLPPQIPSYPTVTTPAPDVYKRQAIARSARRLTFGSL